MSKYREQIAARKANQFFRHLHNKIPLKKSGYSNTILSNLSGSTRKNKKSLERLMRILPELVNIEREYTKDKPTNKYIPITAWISYEGIRTKLSTDESFQETAIVLTAYFQNKIERCRFSWHAIMRLFERYDELLQEHDMDKIIMELAKIFKELNMNPTDARRVKLRNKTLIWDDGKINNLPDRVFNVITFLPKDAKYEVEFA